MDNGLVEGTDIQTDRYVQNLSKLTEDAQAFAMTLPLWLWPRREPRGTKSYALTSACGARVQILCHRVAETSHEMFSLYQDC